MYLLSEIEYEHGCGIKTGSSSVSYVTMRCRMRGAYNSPLTPAMWSEHVTSVETRLKTSDTSWLSLGYTKLDATAQSYT